MEWSHGCQLCWVCHLVCPNGLDWHLTQHNEQELDDSIVHLGKEITTVIISYFIKNFKLLLMDESYSPYYINIFLELQGWWYVLKSMTSVQHGICIIYSLINRWNHSICLQTLFCLPGVFSDTPHFHPFYHWWVYLLACAKTKVFEVLW